MALLSKINHSSFLFDAPIYNPTIKLNLQLPKVLL
jgi:hypothetical protein